MKRMKQLLALICAGIMALSLAACSSSGGSAAQGVSSETAAPAASDGQIVITLATGMAEDHASCVAFKKFIETIEEKSGGRMTGIIYPNNQLGGDVVAMQGVQDGSIVMCWTTGANQVSLVPELAVFDIPFLFEDVDHANRVLADEEFRAFIQDSFNKAGFVNVGFDVTGFRWLTTKNKEIHKLEDLSGLKIRTMENAYHMAAWEALGVTPTPLPNSERYAALQQGTVDGQENAFENIVSTRTYEVQDEFINTKHIAFTASWVINKNFYDSLSEEDRAIFDEAIAVCAQEARDATIANEENLIGQMEGMGKTIIRSLDDGEYERWAAAAQPAAEKLVRQDIGDEPVDLIYSVIEKTR